jgi:hypothetical protein
MRNRKHKDVDTGQSGVAKRLAAALRYSKRLFGPIAGASDSELRKRTKQD